MFACSETVQSKVNFIFKPAPRQGVVAKIQGTEISESDLYKGIESQIYEAETKVYEIKINRLKALVLEKIMEKHPKKKGLSNDKFLEKYITKSVDVSDKKIQKFIEEKKIPAKHVNAQMKQRIKQFLEVQVKKDAVESWLAKQTKNNPVEIYLAKPQRPVRNVQVGDSPFTGGANAKVTIIEFTDFQCPFCSKGSQIMQELKNKYGKKIKIVFKNFPLPFHTQAKKASIASLCAHKQNKKYFWKMYYGFFGDQSIINPQGIEKLAKKVGVEMNAFKECLEDDKIAQVIEKDIEQGKKVGVNSTPTFFVNGQMINGAQDIEVFSEIIDEEFKK